MNVSRESHSSCLVPRPTWEAMTPRGPWRCCLWLTLVLWLGSMTKIASAETFKPPNVVILFADNLAYADIGLFGAPSSAQTPNIDHLGFQGIKLNNWNSAAHLCSASRATLLTGKYPIRTGVYPGVFKPDAVNGLLPNETTIAEIFKEEGYATSIVGKWHLGHRPEFLPTNQGFDEWLGVPYHMSGRLYCFFFARGRRYFFLDKIKLPTLFPLLTHLHLQSSINQPPITHTLYLMPYTLRRFRPQSHVRL